MGWQDHDIVLINPYSHNIQKMQEQTGERKRNGERREDQITVAAYKRRSCKRGTQFPQIVF